ncbi:MAG: hypothetical protein ACKVOQ_04610 [Cyclobacteriaceae bacterium]|jgi:hypothetical protein
MKKTICRFLIFCLASVPFLAHTQDKKEKPAVTYEELYDEPYSVNKLFIGFQPLYGELFATNVNAGFGLEAHYYYKDKMDFKANFRKTYSSQFFDFNRQAALDNSNVQDKPQIFNYYELGGTYHIKDFDESGKTKMVLYKKSFKGNRWAANVPLHAEVPCKVRKIYGARLGGILWNSTVDLNRALKGQGLDNTAIGLPIQNPIDPTKNFNAFANLHSTNVYVGGSMAWFRNVAVSFDKYEEGLDDGLLTLYFDILFAPSLALDDVTYRNPITNSTDIYSTSAIKTSSFGFRAGIDGRFNRTLSWSYGGEIGLRPSVSGQGFYAMFKISFPVFGTNLDYKVESFGK